MKKYGQHITNKYDDYLSSYKYDELIIEKNWNGKLQELKNFCFNNNDDGAWNDPETFEAHCAVMFSLIGGKIYWGERYEKNPLYFQGYEIETIASVGISELSYTDKEPHFFNKDKSRWFNLDYALTHLINRPMNHKQIKGLKSFYGVKLKGNETFDELVKIEKDFNQRIKEENARIERVDAQCH
jgi:hypothetical protein|tara:strand:+ start:53 stop:604 length:552 start_codon:yes stop_codon:yes gene_type:complete